MLFGGMGVPLGMPPQPHDPFMDGVAPERCIVYSSWAGLAVPSADSENESEQLLAEPEIQEFVKKVERMVRVVLAQQAGGDEQQQLVTQTIPDVVKLLLTQPTTIYISNVGVGPDGPTASGALVVKGDERLSATASRLRRIFSQNRDVEVDELEVRGTKFHRYAMQPPAPPVFIGTHKGYLIVATGDGAVNKLMSRIGKEAPEWLESARAALPLERRSTLTYLDVTRIQVLGKQFGGPEVNQIIQATALDDITSVVSTSGLEGKGSVQTVRVNIKKDGRLMDLMSSMKPLTNDDFSNIPADAALAKVANLDLKKIVEFAQESAAIVDPNAARMIDQNLEQMEQQLGFNPKSDLVEALGDRWSIYTSPDTGLFTGLVATVKVDDFQKLNKTLFSLLGMAQAMPDFAISSLVVDGKTIYTMVFDDDIPMSPSFTLTEKELIVALYPQPIRAHMTRPKGKTLATVNRVAKSLGADTAPSTLVYVDTKRMFDLAYPFIQGTYSMMCNSLRREGFTMEPSMLPSAGAIRRHLDSSVMTATVAENAFVIERRQQFPGGSIGATAAFALGVTLPAIGSAQEAAERITGSNNLKQIALSWHNYHDTFRGFPRDSYDDDGKPLLSWRVHILPYIEQEVLYEKFHLDEPWDSEHNKTLIAQMPPVYIAPGGNKKSTKTVYLAPVNEDTIMPPLKAEQVKEDRKFPVGLRIASVTDGTSNTIMVLETSEEIAVPWTKPQDLKIDKDNPIKGLVGLRRNGFQAALCDGSVQFFSELIDEALLNGLFTRNGGEIVNFR
jgi:hypothetical protein